MIIFTLVYKPYKEFSENLRSAYNYFCMLIITSMLLYYSLIDADSKKGVKSAIYPLAVEIVLIVGVIWAYVEVIKDIYQNRCKDKDSKKKLAYQMFDDEIFLKKYQNHLIKSDLFVNRNLLKSFEPVNDSRRKKEKKEKEEPEQPSGRDGMEEMETEKPSRREKAIKT